MLFNIRFYAKNQYRRYYTPHQSCQVLSIEEKEGGIKDRAGFYIIIVDDVNNNVSDDVKKIDYLQVIY